MAMLIVKYASRVEQRMKRFFDSLSEKDRRRFAAIEVEKLGHGGAQYVAAVLGCSADTIRRGQEDLSLLPEDKAAGRVRQKGGSQKLS
jgi:hypothetical protein